MKHFSLKALKEEIAALAVIAVSYMILRGLGISCPIKFVTGISCAGCGMTRAWKALLLHGDFRQAFYYHPLFLLVIPMIILFLLKDRFSPKIRKILIGIFVGIFLVTYLIRLLFFQNDIVCVRPSEGIIEKGLLFLYELLSSHIG